MSPSSIDTKAVVTQYGGFWKRVVAWLIDTVVVSAATGIVIATTLGAGVVAVFFGHWLYEAFMVSSSWQATLGKRAMSLTVTDLQGRQVSFGRATGRYFAKWVSALFFGIGFLIVAFTEKKQGLHDMIARTLVLDHE
jgi:uncharacterized RDD family membrane protein YckC